MDRITVYGAPWCPDCSRSKAFLLEQRIPFDWVDIDADADGLRFVEELQNGGRTIPTIMFPGGSHLLEPSNAELAETLGLQLRAELATRLVAHARRYDVELRSTVEVSGIRREPGEIRVETAGDDEYGAYAVTMTTGSRYRQLGVPGEDGLIDRGWYYCATCDGPFLRGVVDLDERGVIVTVD